MCVINQVGRSIPFTIRILSTYVDLGLAIQVTYTAHFNRCLIQIAKIFECIEEAKLTVLPIFYHVDPSDVRNQMGTLAEAFEMHEKDPKINK